MINSNFLLCPAIILCYHQWWSTMITMMSLFLIMIMISIAVTGQYSTGKSSMIRYLIRQVIKGKILTGQLKTSYNTHDIKSFRTSLTCELDQSRQQTSIVVAASQIEFS